MKGFILVILSLFSILYCFRFGYIWTAYGHGGQLMGIPFLLIMIGLTMSYLVLKNARRKEKVFFVTLFYFLTLALFSITVEIIRKTITNYFELLYLEPGGVVNKIFLAFASAGIIVTVLKLRQINNRQWPNQNQINFDNGTK